MNGLLHSCLSRHSSRDWAVKQFWTAWCWPVMHLATHLRLLFPTVLCTFRVYIPECFTVWELWNVRVLYRLLVISFNLTFSSCHFMYFKIYSSTLALSVHCGQKFPALLTFCFTFEVPHGRVGCYWDCSESVQGLTFSKESEEHHKVT
jgi:hypothetical protein